MARGLVRRGRRVAAVAAEVGHSVAEEVRGGGSLRDDGAVEEEDQVEPRSRPRSRLAAAAEAEAGRRVLDVRIVGRPWCVTQVDVAMAMWRRVMSLALLVGMVKVHSLVDVDVEDQELAGLASPPPLLAARLCAIIRLHRRAMTMTPTATPPPP